MYNVMPCYGSIMGNRRVTMVTHKNENLLKMFPKNTLLASYRGSVSHNTFIPPEDPNSSDDLDLLGVHLFSANVYLGLEKPKEVYESFVDEYDVVSYEFKKMIGMLLKANPNVMSILYLNKDHYLYKNFYGRALLVNRDLFVSTKIYKTFYKYAESELLRLNKNSFNGYMGKKRKRLVEEYGFDCKHASHCIRLLRMGYEFIQTGKLQVYRDKDAQELIDIKTGKWTLEEVKEAAKELFYKADKAFIVCDMPTEPRTKEVLKLVEDIMYDYIFSSRN